MTIVAIVPVPWHPRNRDVQSEGGPCTSSEMPWHEICMMDLLYICTLVRGHGTPVRAGYYDYLNNEVYVCGQSGDAYIVQEAKSTLGERGSRTA